MPRPACRPRAVAPEAGDIDIVERRIYRVHRRIAERYRKGRMCLAGDAAHLNSPKGGMGMNGGIHDALCLADKIVAVAGGADPRGTCAGGAAGALLQPCAGLGGDPGPAPGRAGA